MSMPTFPEDVIDITRDQAFNMLLGSIAMEELGLSHIINAEGEKLQYVLGTLPHMKDTKVTTQELLEVNESITMLLENVAHNQFLLKGKLTQVLAAQEKWSPPPCPPPCPPTRPQMCQSQFCKTAMFQDCHEGAWCAGQRLGWRPICGCNNKSRAVAGECSTTAIRPVTKGVSFVSFSFELVPSVSGQITVVFSQVCNGTCTPILKSCAYAAKANEPVYISGSTVLAPQSGGTPASSLVFTLCEPQKVQVNKAKVILTALD